jgi:hypothetical protein
VNQNLTYKPTNEIQINCIFDRVASKMNLNLITSDTVHVYRHHYTPRKFKSGTWYTAVHFILHVYIKIEVYKSVKIHQINTITAYFWDSTVSCNIHANPRETKSGREGSGPPPEIVFSEGRKMVHSVAFWIYNLFSQIFKYKCTRSMKKPWKNCPMEVSGTN